MKIYNNKPIYFIAEIGQNHQGNIDIAKKMVDQLKNYPISCIKTAKRDIDVCLRLTLNNYSIIKIFDAEVDHLGWSSHFSEIKETMNVSRIWHFTWSSLYFENKFCNKSIVFKKLFRIILFSTVKIILNLIIFRFKKVNQNLVKLSACYAFIFNLGSYFRVKHEV